MSLALLRSTTADAALSISRLQLGCLAPSPAAAYAAIDAGADWIRISFGRGQPETSGHRHDRLADIVRYAHEHTRKLVLDIDAPPAVLSWQDRRAAIAWAAKQGFDAVATPDTSLALYCATRHPSMPLHLVAPTDICLRTARLLNLQLNAARILIPHEVSTAQLAAISANTDACLEILAFAGSPARQLWGTAASHVDKACNDACYLPEQKPWMVLRQLPLLASLRIRAIQVESRSGMPDDIANVVQVWRTAIDRCHEDGGRYIVEPSWCSRLGMP